MWWLIPVIPAWEAEIGREKVSETTISINKPVIPAMQETGG
jgi:hypothetical protein